MGFYIYVRSSFLFTSYEQTAIRTVPLSAFAIMAAVEILLCLQLIIARRISKGEDESKKLNEEKIEAQDHQREERESRKLEEAKEIVIIQ